MMDERIAFYTGYLGGFLARNEIGIEHGMDDDGNYTGELFIEVDELVLTVVVTEGVMVT
jgi:hypothetical protein